MSFALYPISRHPFLRWFITLTVWGLLGYRLQLELHQSEHLLMPAIQDWKYLIMAMALLPLNYFLETLKWRLLIQPLEPELRLGACLKAVLVGASYGLFTPNRIGEYVGRLGAIRPEKRWQAGIATFWNRITQMMATLWMGLAGLLYVVVQQKIPYPIPVYLVVLALLLLLGGYGLILFRSERLFHWLRSKKKLEKYHFLQKILQGAITLSRRKMVISLLLAMGRYLVFSVQYAILFFAFGVNEPFVLIYALGTLVFLIKSFVPSVTLAELGIREVIAIYVFKQIGISTWVAVQATFALFLINLVLPAVVGAFFIPDWFRHKRQRN